MSRELTDAEVQEFVGLACALSPENLSCDGELPPRIQAARRAVLEKRWRDLEAKYGVKVTEDEVWDLRFERAQMRELAAAGVRP